MLKWESYLFYFNQSSGKTSVKDEKQAWAELCQAQVMRGLDKIKIFFHLIVN